MKKFFSLLLSLLLLLSISIAPSAAFQDTSLPSTNVLEKIEAMLILLEREKELFGMENVDFNTLTLGCKVPAYEITPLGPSLLSNISYYPLLDGTRWIATFAVTHTIDDEPSVTLSLDFVDAYNNLLSENITPLADIAILFDECTSYLSFDSKLTVVDTFDKVSSRQSIETISDSISLVGTEVKQLQALEFQPLHTQARSAASYPLVDTLGVPQITQGANTVECWAVCLSSILEYYGISASVSTIFALGHNQMQNAPIAANIMKDNYGLRYGFAGYYNYYYDPSDLTPENIILDISTYGAPIFAGVSLNGIGHALLIQGYVCLSETSTSISYMDPLSGTYKMSSLDDSSGFTYVDSNGTVLSFSGGFAAYE